MSYIKLTVLLFVFLAQQSFAYANQFASKPEEINYDLEYAHSTARNFLGDLVHVMHNNYKLAKKSIYQGRDGFDAFIYQLRKHGTVEKVRNHPVYTTRDCLLMGFCGTKEGEF